MTPEQNGDSSKSELLKLHHHDGDALLSAEMCVLRWHGNTLHQVLHLVLETADVRRDEKYSPLVFGSIALSSQAFADFLSDSGAALGVRNFYFNNDNRDGTAAPSKTEEWTQGLILEFMSGYTDGFGVDTLGLLGLTLAPGKGRHVGSSMIPSDSDNHAVDEWGRLGLTGKVKISKTELHYGTLIPKLPILVANDGRLLPQTFEGGQITSSEFKDLTLTGGRIEHATDRGSTDQTGLAAMGGTLESNSLKLHL